MTLGPVSTTSHPSALKMWTCAYCFTNSKTMVSPSLIWFALEQLRQPLFMSKRPSCMILSLASHDLFCGSRSSIVCLLVRPLALANVIGMLYNLEHLWYQGIKHKKEILIVTEEIKINKSKLMLTSDKTFKNNFWFISGGTLIFTHMIQKICITHSIQKILLLFLNHIKEKAFRDTISLFIAYDRPLITYQLVQSVILHSSLKAWMLWFELNDTCLPRHNVIPYTEIETHFSRMRNYLANKKKCGCSLVRSKA